MRRIRFHIGTLLGIVLILGIALGALRESNEIWDSGVLTLTAGVLLTSVLLALHRTEKRRVFWLGFALFGAAYLVCSLVPSIESRLITTKALAFIDSKVPRSMTRANALYDLLVVNNSQPRALYVNKGNGTFQDVTATVGLDYTGDGTLVLNNSAGLGGTTENFVRIGHSICALIVALLGGLLSRHLHEKNRQTIHGPESPQIATSSVGSGD
jgi:hypothetical protein